MDEEQGGGKDTQVTPIYPTRSKNTPITAGCTLSHTTTRVSSNNIMVLPVTVGLIPWWCYHQSCRWQVVLIECHCWSLYSSSQWPINIGDCLPIYQPLANIQNAELLRCDDVASKLNEDLHRRGFASRHLNLGLQGIPRLTLVRSVQNLLCTVQYWCEDSHVVVSCLLLPIKILKG